MDAKDLLTADPLEDTQWGYTQRVYTALKQRPAYSETGGTAHEPAHPAKTLNNREIISSSPAEAPVRFDGGVYPGINRESIVVDSQHQITLQHADKSLQKMLEAISPDHKNETRKGKTLRIVLNLAQQLLPYDKTKVKELTQFAAKNNSEMDLGFFIEQQAGVCRHQALLCAFLLEKLKDRNQVGGHISLERNTKPDKGSHVWVRYTNSQGVIYIVDPAQNFVGTLADAYLKPNCWPYFREGEREEIQNSLITEAKSTYDKYGKIHHNRINAN